ncbi:MAG: hypothetical protein ABI647_09305 [Gemmatimonadota bacterium]
MTAYLVPIELERIGRYRRVDQAVTGAAGGKGLAIRASPDLVLPSTLDEVIVPRVDREKDAEVAVGVEMQNQEMAVIASLYLYLGAVSLAKLSVTDRELD